MFNWFKKMKNRRQNINELLELFDELQTHIWDNGGFINEKFNFESTHGHSNPTISKNWEKFHKICIKFWELRRKLRS